MSDSVGTGKAVLKLYSAAYPDIAANEVVEKIEGRGREPLFVLAYTPEFCGFVDWRGGAFYPIGGEKPVDDIFELRCFCNTFELRWVREGDTNQGRAILLYDSESGADLSLQNVECEEGDVHIEGGQYLLWGRGTKRQGMVRLFEHRIGELPVPIGVKEKDRVFLTFVEYFKPDRYGNMTFLAERLTGLTVQ